MGVAGRGRGRRLLPRELRLEDGDEPVVLGELVLLLFVELGMVGRFSPSVRKSSERRGR